MWRLMTITGLCMLTVVCVFAQVKPQEQKMITVTGKLERVAAIGGETTGWAIRLDSELKIKDEVLKSINVNYDNEKLEKLENKRVEAKGKITFRNTIERGEWPVLEVSTIKEIKSK